MYANYTAGLNTAMCLGMCETTQTQFSKGDTENFQKYPRYLVSDKE